MRRALAFALGIGADAAFGDPPNALHPVALIGHAAHLLRRFAPSAPSARERYGFAVALGLPAAGVLLTRTLQFVSGRGGGMAALVVDVALLDACCALRTLLTRASEVEAALAAGDLDAGRALCGMHLVSRDTATLTESEVAAATIESVAENLSDGVVAPWLAFAAGGASVAIAYRVANTMDALWGYRTEEFRALGHAVARLDDALNLVPARFTALAIALTAAMGLCESQVDGAQALTTWFADGGRTSSPNAGHPMAAMAGALGVALIKRDAYELGAVFREPVATDIGRAVGVARGAAMLVATCILGALLVTRSR